MKKLDILFYTAMIYLVSLSYTAWKGRPRTIDNLIVNTSNSYRTIIKESEKEGLKEMRKLVGSSAVEEGWAFCPEENIWFEIGKNERIDLDERTSGVEIDPGYLEKLMQKHNRLFVYHFHPHYSLLKSMLNEKYKKEQLNKKERLDLAVHYAIPSFGKGDIEGDISAMILWSNYFYKINPDGEMIWKLCSYYGVVEFYPTDNGRDFYKNMDKSNILSKVEEYRKEIAKKTVHLEDTEGIHHLIKKGIKMVVKEMNNEHLKFTFTPYEEIFQN